MSMSRMSFIENLHLNKNVTAVLSTLAYGKIKKAILAKDTAFFTMLPGIGGKTAEKIIRVGTDLLAEPHPNRFAIPHYAVPMYKLSDMLDPVQRELLDRALDAPSGKEMISILLNQFMPNVREDRGVLRAYVAPEYVTLPASQLSLLLGIEPDTQTDKLCIFRFAFNPLDIIPREKLDSLSSKQRKVLFSALDELKKIIVRRAVESGFVSPSGRLNRFFVCSSGQLKKESGYWMDDETFDRHKHAFSGGLNAVKINLNTGFKPVQTVDRYGNVVVEWKGGKGIPMTKTFQSRALLTSASVPASIVLGKPFRLRNLICVGEFEKTMTANVMSVSESYAVTEGERSDIVNNYGDGFVMLLMDRVGDVVAQIRGGTEIKGCGAAVDWQPYCRDRGYDENEQCFIIRDVDGVEHDLRQETHIYGIVNTTVFKGLKKYGSWKHYVECMEKYGLDEIHFCAIEEAGDPMAVETKRLSRQMMQSLFALTDDEIRYLASDTIGKCNSYEDLHTATEIVGEMDRDYDRRSNIGKLVSVYPDMLADSCIQKVLRDLHLKQYNSLMCGELNVNGTYHFVIPDPCAIMDVLFGKKDVEDPSIGWLKAGECFCDMYRRAEQLCLLRSPHAFMEWVVANTANACPYVASGPVYTSVHDLFYRVLQMDYDGDHLLMIDDPTLCRIASGIRRKFDIPVLYYEPSVANNPGPMPTDRKAFVEKICECIEMCAKYNKVGQYSNLVTAAWSTYRPDMSAEEFRELMKHIAIIAAAINHAVDAQKTYQLKMLEDEATYIIEMFKKKPNSERYKNATPDKPNSDPRWDVELRRKGLGVVDRLSTIASMHVSDKLNLDTSSLHFDWRMLKHPDPRFSKQVNQAVFSPEFVQSVESLAHTNNEVDLKVIDKMKRGERVGWAEFLPLLKFLNGAFFEQYKKQTDDVVDIECTHAMRVQILRGLLVDFVRQSESARGMNEDELLMYAASAALRTTYSAKKYLSGAYDLRRFIFDTFGDLYAECVMLNIAANVNTAQEDEEDEPEFFFHPDFCDAPPAADDYYDAMLFNEYDDLL